MLAANYSIFLGMDKRAAQLSHLRSLLDRLARVAAAEDWAENLNPAQTAALGYLARANKFSRSPSNVAEYLGTTRGTVSQSLKSLQQKGLIEERRSETDRRSISYDLTDKGWALVSVERTADKAIESLDDIDKVALEATLNKALIAILKQRGQKEFGQCKSCRYHQPGEPNALCKLLDVSLTPIEAEQICHEFLRQSLDT